LFAALAVLPFASPALSNTIPVLNSSFESPSTPYATAQIDDWQDSYGTADQSVGVFLNSPSGTSSYITNLSGSQGAFMFSAPGLSISQTLSNTYQVGQTYQLAVGIEGGGNGMPLNFPMTMELFYLDGGGNKVSVGSPTTVYNDNTGTITYLPDRVLTTAPVGASDPWAGKNIGIELLQTNSDVSLSPFYWDIDNVRLQTVPEPGSMALLAAAGLSCFVLQRRRLLATQATTARD
jgi:hypothetical protein